MHSTGPADSPAPRITLGEWIVVPAVWLALATVAWPFGEFTLNDDWAYTIAVRNLVHDGRLQLTDWGAMSLVAHVFWGAAITLPFGLSFTALRCGTVILGAVGLLACLALFREAGLTRRTSRMATMLVAANPIYFLFACSFMTDIPFFAAVTGVVLFWLRWHRTRAPRHLVAAFGLLVLATLVRQVTVGVGIGLAIATLVRRGFGWRSLLEAAGTAALPFAVLLAFDAIAAATFGMPETYANAGAHLKIALAELILVPGATLQRYGPFVGQRVLASLLFLGLFSLPLVVARTALLRRRPGERLRPTAASGALVVAGAAGLAAAVAFDVIYPYFGLVPSPFPANALTGLTLGPPTLSDSLLAGWTHTPPGPRWLRLTMTAVAVAGAVGLLGHALAALLRLVRWLLFRGRAGRERERLSAVTTCFCFVGGGLYILPFWLAVIFFDRYVILLLPLALILLGRSRPDGADSAAPGPDATWRRSLGMLLVGLMLLGSVAGTHDFLAWNRTVWTTANRLVHERGVAPDDIDAGFAYNMWHRYPAFPTEPGRKVWWCPGTGRLMLTFGPVEGYRTVETHRFSRWLPGGSDRLWLLERIE